MLAFVILLWMFVGWLLEVWFGRGVLAFDSSARVVLVLACCLFCFDLGALFLLCLLLRLETLEKEHHGALIINEHGDESRLVDVIVGVLRYGSARCDKRCLSGLWDTWN